MVLPHVTFNEQVDSFASDVGEDADALSAGSAQRNPVAWA
jgi:hypothetical protein